MTKFGQPDNSPQGACWGSPESELVEIIMADKPRFKRTATVVYRGSDCRCLLGFVYPVKILSFEHDVKPGQFDDEGRLVVRAPEHSQETGIRPSPYGPWVACKQLPTNSFYETKWLFAFRHVDPEFLYIAPSGGIGFTPAGKYMGYRVGEHAPDEVIQNSSVEEISVAGERNVWRIEDWYSWSHHQSKHHGLTPWDNPAGLMNCKHYEYTVLREQVEADEATYNPKKPVLLPRANDSL